MWKSVESDTSRGTIVRGSIDRRRERPDEGGEQTEGGKTERSVWIRTAKGTAIEFDTYLQIRIDSSTAYHFVKDRGWMPVGKMKRYRDSQGFWSRSGLANTTTWKANWPGPNNAS